MGIYENGDHEIIYPWMGNMNTVILNNLSLGGYVRKRVSYNNNT